jgi:hypothetical protein
MIPPPSLVTGTQPLESMLQYSKTKTSNSCSIYFSRTVGRSFQDGSKDVDDTNISGFMQNFIYEQIKLESGWYPGLSGVALSYVVVNDTSRDSYYGWHRRPKTHHDHH